MNLGESIKYCRSVRKLTQKELAEKSGVSKSYICLIENGERDASISVLNSIAEALSIPTAIMVFIASEGKELDGDISDKNIERLNKLVKELISRASK